MLLGRYARAEDVVVGTPLANRSRPELEGLIGYFVNTVALRADLSGTQPTRCRCRRCAWLCAETKLHSFFACSRFCPPQLPLVHCKCSSMLAIDSMSRSDIVWDL